LCKIIEFIIRTKHELLSPSCMSGQIRWHIRATSWTCWQSAWELIKYNLIISTYLPALARCGRLNLIIAVGKCCENLLSYNLKWLTALVDQFSGRSLIKLHSLFTWTSFTRLFPQAPEEFVT